MAGRPYILSETNWKTVRKTEFEVAILPWGATEAHNFHLPFGTDTIQVEAVAAESARQAWEQGSRCLVLPPVPFGSNAQQVDIPHTINLNPTTQAFLLSDLVESLEAQGLSKLLILNGHGGNDFRPMIRELQPQVTIFLCMASWYQVGDWADYFEDVGDHAGEMETSIMLQIAPDLVLPLSEAGDGAERRYRIEAFREKWAWAPRRWTQVSKDTGVGNPALATREKGERYTAAVVEQLGRFLVDLAAADPDDLYE